MKTQPIFLTSSEEVRVQSRVAPYHRASLHLLSTANLPKPANAEIFQKKAMRDGFEFDRSQRKEGYIGD
ncbi:MAG: hypothetical protein ACXVB9_20190 [Bdellovibrionota bacterium]